MKHLSSRIQKILAITSILCAISIPALAKAPQEDLKVRPIHPILSTLQECVLSFQDYLKTETRQENGVEVTVMHLHAEPDRFALHPLQQLSFADEQPLLAHSERAPERSDPSGSSAALYLS